MIGTVLSHYRILDRIGQGGMGIVYRARDERLERDVALKVLPEGSLAAAEARHRFHREALALSRLNHPHIATIHDFDRQDDTDFLVMELVEGPSLAEKLASGALPEREVVELGSQIAEALEAAHERAVIHRDLKPANITITSRGQVKVLDFGIANLLQPEDVGGPPPPEAAPRPAASRAVEPAPGTLPYMAPEQLLGAPGDARSDLYALGVVLYEMSTGRPPFQSQLEAALVYEITNVAPLPPSRVRPDLSQRLEDVILKCLEKNPDYRYPSARELAADLKRMAAGEAAAALAARAAPRAAPRRIESLAVLPMLNLSGDPEQEFFADGMTDALIADLAQVTDLRVISRTSVMRFKGTHQPLAEIAAELAVDAVVEGSVVRAGGRVRITAQLVEAATDRNLWASTYQRDLSDILSLQGEVAAAIAAEVRAKLTPSQHARLRDARPVDPGAYEAYLRGRQYWNRRTEPELRHGIEFFRQAIDMDPAYALAYAGLADSYNILGDMAAIPPDVAASSAKAAASRALEIDPDLAEAYTSLGFVRTFFEWNWADAESAYRRAVALKPNYATARQWFAELLASQARFDEALAQAQKAVDLDPLAVVLRTSLADVSYFARRYDRAIEVLRDAIHVEPGFVAARTDLGRVLSQAGRYDEAIDSYETALRLSGSDPKASPGLGHALALAGRHAEARRILETLKSRRAERYISPHSIAVIHVGLGEPDPAFEWLRAGVKERDRALVWMKVHPRLDPLRGDERFDELARSVAG